MYYFYVWLSLLSKLQFNIISSFNNTGTDNHDMWMYFVVVHCTELNVWKSNLCQSKVRHLKWGLRVIYCLPKELAKLLIHPAGHETTTQWLYGWWIETHSKIAAEPLMRFKLYMHLMLHFIIAFSVLDQYLLVA